MNIIAINYGTYIYPSAVSIIYVESAFPNFLYEYIRDIETMLDNNLECESRFYELTLYIGSEWRNNTEILLNK